MPNYCSNSLDVSADVKDIQALKQLEDFVKTSIFDDGDKFTFEGVLPMPKELLDITCPTQDKDKAKAQANLKRYGHTDWYDWRIAVWGAKWDAYDTYTNDLQEDYVGIGFTTAWSPPLPYYKALSEKYPLLTIEAEYSEPGCDFAGREKYEGGELVEEEHYTYNMYEFIYDKPNFWDNLYYQFEDEEYTLEDFIENCGDIWEIMNETDKDEVRDIIKQTQNQEL